MCTRAEVWAQQHGSSPLLGEVYAQYAEWGMTTASWLVTASVDRFPRQRRGDAITSPRTERAVRVLSE